MSDSSKAVFLSYASQDAEAARRICDALRAAGVEVWFDQSELRGGDAWDAKIRRQIKECALFVPIISANTQARAEGYFRLEWKLAVDRSHLMADDQPFLFPVAIDDTPDATARVPDKFRDVQWTRLRLDETPGELASRVAKLLGGEADVGRGRLTPPSGYAAGNGGVGAPARHRKARPNWLRFAWAGVGIVFALVYALRPMWQPASRREAKAPVIAPPAAPRTESQSPTVPPPTADPTHAAETVLGDKSVAVLAFANLSDDKANEYFSDGISEELLNVLAKIPDLKVSARTSAFYFKGKEVPVPEIARQLGVAYIVEGSVRKQGTKVRITAQLIKAADGFHVWSDTFTRDLKDIFAVQDEIAGLIAKNLSLRLGVDRPVSGRATVPEAFELYLMGRMAWNLRTQEGYARAEKYLAQAIDLDPGFARAHSALADVWSIAGYENERGGGTYGWRNSPTVAKITAKAEQALALDPQSAEAYTSRALALEFGWKWDEAERAYQRAIELNPNYATARHWFGMLLWVQGKIDEALWQLKQAAESDPLSHRILDTYARMLNQAGRPGEALAVADRALALQPMAVQAATQKAHALVLLGRANEAVALVEKILALEVNTGQRTDALLILQLAGAEATVRRIIGSTEDLPSSQFKFASLIAFGRLDEALVELRPADLHENQLINMALLQFYDPVRDDPRFLHALSEVGYMEYYRRARSWLTSNVPKEKK